MIEGTNPHISKDCFIFGFDLEKLNVLLLERSLDHEDENIAFCDHSLVGQHIRLNDSLDNTAAGILYESTGLSNIYLEQFYTFGNPDRSIRERDKIWLQSIGRNPALQVITIGYFSLENTNAVHISHSQRNASWCDVKKVENLAFDHDQILKKGLEALRLKIKSEPIAFELLPQ